MSGRRGRTVSVKISVWGVANIILETYVDPYRHKSSVYPPKLYDGPDPW